MPESNESNTKELSGTELLKFLREISGHAEKEVARVSAIYKIAARCITGIFIFGGIIFGIIYFQTLADIKKDLKDETERQKEKMHEQLEVYFQQIQTQLDQQVAIHRQTVEKKVDDEFKQENIAKLVRDKAQERIDIIADPLITDKISESIQPKIDDVDRSLQQAKGELQATRDVLKKVQDDSDFLNVLSKAQNDDRRAFDQLRSWASNPNFYRQKDAEKAWEQIRDENDRLSKFIYEYEFPWKEGLDPSTLSLGQLRSAFVGLDAYSKMALLRHIWKRTDFTKRQKMDLMIDVMKTDESLMVVAEASRLFQTESKQATKPLAVDLMFDWWEKNENSISDTPESDVQGK